tara:strand:- start:1128 stop:1598 length:471 start_codon:yes stop_codon:yes gene_type:complete
MGTYVSTSQVNARLPYRTIDSNSSPTATQVSEWIDEAEALLHGALNTAEVTTPITGADGIKIMRSWVLDYAVGRTRIAYASSGGDGGNDAGVDEIETFNERVNDIMNYPMKYSAMLNAGSGSSSCRQIRGVQTDNADSLTVAGGDFKPSFSRDEVF